MLCLKPTESTLLIEFRPGSHKTTQKDNNYRYINITIILDVNCIEEIHYWFSFSSYFGWQINLQTDLAQEGADVTMDITDQPRKSPR